MPRLKRAERITDAAMQATILEARAKNRSISVAKLTTLRSNQANGTGWGQRDLDALIARMAEDGLVHLPKG